MRHRSPFVGAGSYLLPPRIRSRRGAPGPRPLSQLDHIPVTTLLRRQLWGAAVPAAEGSRDGEEAALHQLAHAGAQLAPHHVTPLLEAPVGARDVEQQDDAPAGAGELAGRVAADALEAEPPCVEAERRVRVVLKDVGQEVGVAALDHLDDGGAQ